MAIVDRITENAERLPTRLQREVLDFVQYLLHQYHSSSSDEDGRQHSRELLAADMTRLDEEEGPERDIYSEADLKERYR